MSDLELEVCEALLEGMAVELIPEPTGDGWYCRVGMLPWSIQGRTAAEVMLKLADLLSKPIPEGRGQQ